MVLECPRWRLAKIIEQFDAKGITIVSVTQQFNADLPPWIRKGETVISYSESTAIPVSPHTRRANIVTTAAPFCRCRAWT
jgi:hypothetical protein